MSEFKKIHLFLTEEQLLLQKLAKEEKDFVQSVQANLANLSEQSTALGKLITELEEKCQQSSLELLEVRVC